jgi:hypothetical protein
LPAEIECSKCRFGGGAFLLVAARSSPCGAARGTVKLAMIKIMAFVTLAIILVIEPMIVRYSRNRPNVLTLSCKSRPPCRPPWGGAAAAATNMQWRERTAAGVTPACSSEPPQGGSAAEPRLGGFCQLVRAVRPFGLEYVLVSKSTTPIAFVIMPFAAPFEDVFAKLIKPALEGYEVVRADTRFDERSILAKIMTGIDEAALVVADITETNANVMYELGVAHALGKPTVMIARSVSNLPFDIRAYPVHEYSLEGNGAAAISAHLKELAARHRDGFVDFANPVADFVEHVVVSVHKPQRDIAYSFEYCKADIEWAGDRLESFYARFSGLLQRYSSRLDDIRRVITHRKPGQSVIDDPGIRMFADEIRNVAHSLEELSVDFHAIWDRFGRAMLWFVDTEQREQIGDVAISRQAEYARGSDQMLNGILGHLADLRYVNETFPNISGNLSHALEIERLAITTLLNEIMTAKAYLARIARDAER